ncbi:MAG TPA: hypothetical protein VIY08_14440 [Candidatus Nitrosocosmicus sp.]
MPCCIKMVEILLNDKKKRNKQKLFRMENDGGSRHRLYIGIIE